MLSNKDIAELLSNKEISIFPFREKQLRACGVTFHLGENILVPQKGYIIDVKRRVNCSYKKIRITDELPYELKPDEFILCQTFEAVSLSNKISLLIEGRSTLARFGLTIVQTAMLVE